MKQQGVQWLVLLSCVTAASGVALLWAHKVGQNAVVRHVRDPAAYNRVMEDVLLVFVAGAALLVVALALLLVIGIIAYESHATKKKR